MPKAHMTVLDAPDLMLPPDVRTIAVVHRVTGPESSAALAATAGFEQTIDAAVGLDGVVVQVAGAWPAGPLPAEVVAQTCALSGADALAVLEALSSDSDLKITEDEPLAEDEDPNLQAQRSSRVSTTWRLLGRDGGQLDLLEDVVSADRWTSDGDEAEARVPGERNSVVDLGRSAGVGYARRISPSWTSVVRDYYVAGDPRLRQAAIRVEVADWEGAMELWQDVADSDRPARVRARALYDMGLGWEVLGRPIGAVRSVEQAASLHDTKRIQSYLALLRERRTELRPLRYPLAQQEVPEDP